MNLNGQYQRIYSEQESEPVTAHAHLLTSVDWHSDRDGIAHSSNQAYVKNHHLHGLQAASLINVKASGA
jgi:hypothetical protein